MLYEGFFVDAMTLVTSKNNFNKRPISATLFLDAGVDHAPIDLCRRASKILRGMSQAQKI